MQTTTESILWFVFWACVGGVVVLVGLVIEVLAEKRWFSNVNSFRRWECAKHIGEWMVIGGILIEVIVAGAFATEEWQTKQLVIKNDPLNLPVKSMRAEVYIVVYGPDVHVKSEQDQIESEVAKFGEYMVLVDKSGKRIVCLSCDEYDNSSRITGENPGKIVSMVFNWPNANLLVMKMNEQIGQTNFSARQLDNNIGGAVLLIPELANPKDRIGFGSFLLTINGSMERRFSMPKPGYMLFPIVTNSP